MSLLFLMLMKGFAHPNYNPIWKKTSSQTIEINHVSLEVSNGVLLRCTKTISSEPIGAGWCFIETPSPQEALVKAEELHMFDAWPDIILPQKQMFNDPLFEGQWYLNYLETEKLFSISTGSSDTIVSVIDSGIDIAHPDLNHNLHAPYDVVDNDDDPSPNPGDFCYGGSNTSICDEHGTAVSGIISAKADNNVGMVGICSDCTLLPIRMLGGSNLLSNDVRAFSHAIDEGAWVINNSWGFTEAIPVPPPLKETIQEAYNQGRNGRGSVIIFAAGNEDREIEPGELCDLEEVLCVAAIDRYGRPTNYTNFGSSIDISAPSATVSIAPQESTTINFGGTSAAAPVVSGIASWILSEHPNMTSAEVYDLLLQTAIPSPLVTHNEEGHHPFYGYGVISIQNLLDTLYPTEEEPKSVGCTHIPIIPYFLSPLLFLLYRRR